jgi:ABC-type thiamine transport system ATPase subunit
MYSPFLFFLVNLVCLTDFFIMFLLKRTLFALFQDKNIFKHLQALQLHSLGTGFSVDGKDFQQWHCVPE